MCIEREGGREGKGVVCASTSVTVSSNSWRMVMCVCDKACDKVCVLRGREGWEGGLGGRVGKENKELVE